ncbi:DUF6531 domain-containing protein, partial [Marinibactrum halimedae]
MAIYVTTTNGERYTLEIAWPNMPSTRYTYFDFIEFVSACPSSELKRIHSHYFGLTKDISKPMLMPQEQPRLKDQHNAYLTNPKYQAPRQFNQLQKDIFLALVHNRLEIKEAPLSLDELSNESALLRQKIQLGLRQIIAQEQAEAAQIEADYQQRSTLGKAGAYVQSLGEGLGEAAWGLAVWAKDIVEVAHKVSPQHLSYVASKAAFDYTANNKSFADSGGEYLTGLKKEAVDVLGFDPTKITRAQFEQAMDVATLIYDDPSLRQMIGEFAKDYVAAQHSLEWTEIAGGGVFEIILTIVLAAVTGGVGAAVAAAKNIRLIKSFRKVGELMMKFAKSQKSRLKALKKRAAKAEKADYKDIPTSDGTPETPSSDPAKEGREKRMADKQKADEANSESKPESSSTETGENGNNDKTPNDEKVEKRSEPINLKTGEEQLILQDAVLDGPLPLVLARAYRSSNAAKDSPLGFGWSHTLDESLTWDGQPDSQVQFHDYEGRRITFPVPEPQERSHNIVEHLTLTRLSDQHWVITPYGAIDGVQKHFKHAGEGDPNRFILRQIADDYGNYYRFLYSKDASQGRRLARIESSLGDALHLTPSPCGRIQQVIRETADGQKTALAQYRYSEAGDLLSATDTQGFSEHYQFNNHMITQRTLKTGYQFHWEWSELGPAGKCLHQWGDPINDTPTYDYRFQWDDDGKGVTVTDTRGGVEVVRFDERGNMVYNKDPMGAETHYHYNALGQLLQTDLPAHHNEHRTEKFEYDKQGRLSKKIDVAGNEHTIAYNASGLPSKITNPDGHTWERRYNLRGQIKATIDPLGNKTTYTYNPIGLVGSVTDALGNTTRYLWNNHGKLTAVHDPMGRTQHYVYDNAQRLIEVKHAQKQSTHYQYDSLDRISAVTTPDGAKTQYRYNPQGLVSEIIDAEGRSTQYFYDGLSQVSKRINPDGTALHYAYDGERNLIGLLNEKGERYQLKYDLKERLTEEVGFDGRTTRYAYNQAGHLIASRAVMDPQNGDGIDTLFERDPFGRLLRENTPDGVTDFQYNASGQLTEAKNAHRTLKWTYDACGRVIHDWQGHDKLTH